jgi:hypothetical protein
MSNVSSAHMQHVSLSTPPRPGEALLDTMYATFLALDSPALLSLS